MLIGVIAIETAPAATLLVLREYESEGPVTNHLLVLIGLNNIVCIIIFKIILSVFVSEAHSTLIPVLEVIVSIVIGVIIGIIISFIEKWLEKPVEILMLVIGGITLNIGIAYGVDQSIANYFPGVKFQISNLLANLFMGVALINSTTKGDTSFKALKNADLPIYAIFFVLAGASLHLHDFLESGFIIILFIILYVIGRSFGKIFGSLIGVKYAKLYPKLRNNLGFGLLTHAGVAIGLAYMIQDNLSGELGKTLSTVIFSAVVVFELTGPIFTRFAIIRSGEVKEISLSKKKYHTTKRSYQKVFVRLKHSLGFSKIKVLSKVGKIRCNDVMRSNVESILDSLPFDEVLKFASHCKYDQFPVVDNDHHFLGTISYSEIRDVLFDPEFAYLVIARDIMNEDPPIAYPNDSLKKLLVKFHTSEGDLDYLPVIDDHEPPHLIGMVTQKDVISAFRGIKQENEKKDF
ncbi:MAG: CBS domain-containing protein [Spirochaetota bacterium]|nr:CBS domain-containing protein [Spirochaetota bacterium]